MADEAPPQQFINNYVAPELFATGGLWRRAPHVCAIQKMFKYRLKDGSAPRCLAVAVKRPVEQHLHELIDHHVAWPSVKSQDILRTRAGRKGSEVGDPAKVLHDPANPTVAQKNVV